MNTSSSWGNSTGFGQPAPNTANAGNPTPGLFGNSNSGGSLFGKPAAAAPPTNGLFGAASTPSQGGLFGNSTGGNTANNTNASGGQGASLFGNSAASGLFGNSSTQANNQSNPQTNGQAGAQPAAQGGLFGNTQSQNTGLFGNTQSQSTGLFGAKPAAGSTPSGGLFSNNATANTGAAANTGTGGGLFGSASSGLFGSTQKPQTGGLFSSTGTQGGLFGKPAAPGLSGNNTQSGGLFGGSSQTPSTNGLFGGAAQNTSTSGLFGGSAQASSSNGLFGNSSNQPSSQHVSAAGANPYGSNSVLSNIMHTEQNMPQSITNSLLEKTPERKRSFASTSSKKQKSQSLLGRLAQTFNIFRTASSSGSDTLGPSLRGIFTQQNYVNDVPGANYKVKKPKSRHDARFNPHTIGSIKKLIINSKPSKFHLIDADKVFKAKRRRVITSGGDARNYIASSEDEASDIEDVEAVANKPKIAGESTKNSEVADKDVTGIPHMNDGYFCSPPIKDLLALSPQQLTEVPNLIVGRVGHGQIAYSFPVDCSQLFERCGYGSAEIAAELFGKIIKIDDSVVRVYDDASTPSPAMGFELNVPATITLKAPPKKNTTIDSHIKRLQNITGMDFVTFDPITYNWTFKVKHFSVWGLIDDSEEEGDEAEEKGRLRDLKKRQDAGEAEASVTYSRLYENELYHTELKRQKIERSTSGLPGGWEFDTTIKMGGSLAIKQNLVENEINREVNNFKQDQSAIVLAANASDITDTSDNEAGAESSTEVPYGAPLSPSETKNYDYLKQIVSVLPPNTDMCDLVDERAYEPDIEDEGLFDNLRQLSTFPTSSNWLVQLELANDLNSALASAHTFAKKAQSTMSAVNDILFTDMTNDQVDLNQASTPKQTTKEPRFIEEATSFDKTSMAKAVQSLLLKSHITSRENKFPILEFDSSLNFTTVSAIFAHDNDSQFLELASILFDAPNVSALAKYSEVDFTNVPLVKRLETLEKRASFCKWLQKYNRDTATSSDDIEKVFLKLCSGELKSAIELAVNTRNNHLAALLTLVDSNDSAVRSIASAQLDSWSSSGSGRFVPEPVQKIYRLLAGKYESFRDSLPYNVYLGLQVYYGDETKPLEELFEEVGEPSVHDKLSDVLKIYTSHKSATMEDTMEAIHKSELSKLARWGLAQMLFKEDSNAAVYDQISSTFGMEIQKAGLWKEAIYVFASMKDDDSVKQRVRNVVIENVEDITDNQGSNEEYLVTVLGVPRSLVYEAISVHRKQKGDIWGSGEALVVAEMWEQAHDIIVQELGPHAVVEDDATLKGRLQTLVESFPNGGAIIPSWNQGAGFFSKYLAVLKANDDYAFINSADLDFLLTNCALLPENNTTVGKACYKLLAKTIGDLAIEQRDELSDVSQKVHTLSMGENEKVYFEGRLAAAGL